MTSEHEWRPATATYSSFNWCGLIWYEREIGGEWKHRRLMPLTIHPDRSESDGE